MEQILEPVAKTSDLQKIRRDVAAAIAGKIINNTNIAELPTFLTFQIDSFR